MNLVQVANKMKQTMLPSFTITTDAETQTEEFDYPPNARPSVYEASDIDFFDTNKKIGFYTGVPSWEILMVVFEHVAVKCSFSRPTLPVCSFNIHSFKDLLIMDGGNGCAW